MKVRLLLVEDHPVMLEGLSMLLSQHPRLEVADQAENGAQAIRAFERRAPDLVVTDLSLPDMSGAQLISELRRRQPEVRVLVLTIHGGGDDIYRAVQAGCRGYLLKNARREELFRAIETVHAGARCFPAEVAARLAERTEMDQLTPREMEVLGLLAAGKRDRDIALSLRVGEPTIRTHLTSILSKLRVGSRTQAILAALELGLVRRGA